MPTILITPPAALPVTLTEAKDHCRVDGSEFDTMFNNVLIPAAAQAAEAETGRALCSQVRELILPAFADEMILQGSPIVSVSSVKYLDASGTEQTLSASVYQVDKDSAPGTVTLAPGKAWPTTYESPASVRIRFSCGYGAPADVPASIKMWMLLAIGTMKAQAETMADSKMAALPDRFWHRLLDPHRIYEAM